MAEEQGQAQKQPSFLARIYYKIEDAYYSVMEFFENKLHVPLIKYFVEPIEKHNIPSMPIALLLLLLVAGGLFFAFGGVSLPAQKIPFTVSVMAADGTPLDGATVTLSGAGYKETTTSVNGVAEFSDVPKDAKLLLVIKKEGFATITKRITVTEKGYSAKMAAAAQPSNPAKNFLQNNGYSKEQVTSMSDEDAEKLASKLGYQNAMQVSVSVKVIDASSNAPLDGAAVNYEPGSGLEYTGSDGVASFQAPSGSTVSISASKDGYNPGVSSFTAEEGYLATLRLSKKTTKTNPAGSDKPAKSTDPVAARDVIVIVKGVDKNGKSIPVANAVVTLKRAEDYTDLSTSVSGVTSNSPVVFANIPVGQEVIAVVTADGFAALKTPKQSVKAEQDLTITAILQQKDVCTSFPCDSGEFDFQVFVKDDKNRSISGAKVFLLDEDDATLKNASTDSNGFASLKAEAGTTARIIVLADKYLANYSSDLTIGEDINYSAFLALANQNNSATLSIKVVEFDGKPAPNAFTKIKLTAPGLRPILLPVQKTTSSAGVAEYSTPFPAGWVAEASAMGANLAFNGRADAFTLVPGKNNVTITLYPNTKKVVFKAVDAYSKEAVPANFTTYVRNSNTALASCEQTTQEGCTQEIYAGVDFDVKVTSPTHLGRTVQVPKLSPDPNTGETIIVDLLPSTLSQSVFAGLCKNAELTDCEQQPGDYTLQVGQTYYAKFLVKIAAGSDSYGLVVRAGDKNGLLADDAAIVRSPATLTPDSVWSESAGNTILAARGQPKTGCGAIESSNGLYKIVSVTRKNQNDSYAQVIVPIIVASNARPSFKLYYAAWNHVNGSFIREPYDEALKDAALPANAWCSPAMNNASYKVDDLLDPKTHPGADKPKHHFLCGTQACLELRYSQNVSSGVNYGGNGFVVDVPYTPATEPLTITYSLTDFDPDPEESSTLFTLEAPASRLALQTPNPYAANYSGAPFGNQKNIGGGTASESITAWPIQAGSAIIKATYGVKLPLIESALLLSSKFRGTTENTYYVHYDAENNELQVGVKNAEGEFQKRDAITLNTTPVMPADAVYLKLDYESLPPECADARIQFMPLPACFSFDNTRDILKFDASSAVVNGAECPYYDPNPNNVLGTNDVKTPTQKTFTVNGAPATAEAIRLAVFCSGLNAKEFPVTITPDNSQQALTLIRIPARASFSEEAALTSAGVGPSEKTVTRTVFAPITCGKNLGYSYAPAEGSISFVTVGAANKWNRQMTYGSKWSHVFRCRLNPNEKCSLDPDVTGTGGSSGKLSGKSYVFNNGGSGCSSPSYNQNEYGLINESAEYLPFARTISNITDYAKNGLCNGDEITEFFNPLTNENEMFGGAFWRVSSDKAVYDYLKGGGEDNDRLRQELYGQAPGIYVLVNNRQYGAIDRIRVLVDNFPLANPAQETVYSASKPGIIAVFAAFNTTPMINVSIGDIPSVINQAFTYPNPPEGSEYPFINYSALPADPSYIGAAKKYVEKYVNHYRGASADLDYKLFPLAAFTADPVVELHWFTDNSAAMRVPVPGAPRNGEGLFDFQQTITDLKEATFPQVKMTPLKLSQYGGPLQLVCSNPTETTLLGRNFFILTQEDGTKCIQSSWDAQHKVFGDPVSAPCNDECVVDDQCNANNSQYTLKVAFLTGESYVCMRDNPVGFEGVVPRGACLKIQGGGIKGTDFSVYGPDGKKLAEMDPDEWTGLDDNSRAEYVMETLMAHPDLARLMADLGDKNSPPYQPKIAKHTLSAPSVQDLDDAIDSDAAVYLGADYKLAVHHETNRDESDECYYLPAANEYYCPKNKDYEYARWALYGAALGFGAVLGPLAGAGAAMVGEAIITGAETHSWGKALEAGLATALGGGITACYATGGGSSCWGLARARDTKGEPLFYESFESTTSMKALEKVMFADEEVLSATVDEYMERLSKILSPNQTRFFTELREAFRQQVNETNYVNVTNGVSLLLVQSRMGADYLLENYTFPPGKKITREKIQKDRDFLEQVIALANNTQTPEQAADLLTLYVITSSVINEISRAYNQAEHLNQRYLNCAQKKQTNPEKYAGKTCPPCVLKDRCELSPTP
ncbi:MAG: hypothetical protein ACP5IG_04115 [Candidatus Micrarchaeia archaeon]